MPTLPARPSFEHLKKQAKRLLKSARDGDPAALAQVGPYFGDPAKISLQQAQLVIARDHGFSSWTRLKRHIDAGAGAEETTEQRANRFLDLACMYYGLDPARGPADFATAAALLAAHPEIADHTLHTAAAAGNTGTVARLLAEGAPVDEPGGPFQWTPLMYAAYARLPGVSTWPAGKALLDAGADPNAHHMWGGTYRFAVLTGIFGDGEGGTRKQPPHPEMVPFARAALDAGANPNDCQGAYNRCFSPDNTHLELMLEYGLTDSDPSDWWLTEAGRKPEDHRTMHFQLIMALRWGFADRARLLIEHGVDIDSPDNNYYPTYTVGYTPYQVALMRGLPEIAALIEAKGGRADPLPPPQQFQAACMAGDLAAARALAPEHQGRAPGVELEMLSEAAGNNRIEAVRTMIALGFALSPPATRTPLHVAAYKGHAEMVSLLLDAGADPLARDPQHCSTPLGHAMHVQQESTIAHLMAAPMDIFAAATLSDPARIDAALAARPEMLDQPFAEILPDGVNAPAHAWAPPLWFAVINGRADNVAHLLALGADPAVTDPEGRDLATIARDAGHDAIAERLDALP